MFSKNNKKMIAERSAERTLKYGLVKLNVGLASVLLATGLTFVGSQAASADTVTTSTEAQTTDICQLVWLTKNTSYENVGGIFLRKNTIDS